jgi:hypothetical protein
VLQNRFVYLAHDDGWYCKLFCRNINDFHDIVANLVRKYVGNELNSPVTRKDNKEYTNKDRNAFLKTSADDIPSIYQHTKQIIYRNWNEGLFIDLNGMQIINNTVIIKTYIIGKFDNMDIMFNNINQFKDNSSHVDSICFNGKEWIVI